MLRFLRLFSVLLLLSSFPLYAGAKSARVTVRSLTPQTSADEGGHVYEKWLFRSEAEIDKWNAAGIEQGSLGPDGLSFAVKEDQGALFRPLPDGFHEHVDALKIYIGPSDLTEVSLLLLKTDAAGKIVRSFRLALNPTPLTLADGEYVPLTFYRPDIAGTDIFAISFRGNTERVTFGGVRFLDYSWEEKILGSIESFWTFDRFRAYTINLIVGPLVIPDPGMIALFGKAAVSLATSVNAYLYVLLLLIGIALLFQAVFRARREGIAWAILRTALLRRFFLILLAVWLLYDFRMGLEYLRNVYDDHRQYITADASTRTFRDRGRFYDFADFVKPLVSDRKRYEVFLPSAWPYFGLLRYETYPALPNSGEPFSDTWVVYERADLTVGADRRLSLAGKPITRPGGILGQFGSGSFIFREGRSKESNETKEANEQISLDSLDSLHSFVSL